MTGGGGRPGSGGAPPSSPSNGGEFLLQLLQKPPQSQNPTSHLHHQHHHLDPAVAALGPTLNPYTSNGHEHLVPPPPWMMNPSNYSSSPTNNNTPWGLAGLPPPPNLQSTVNSHHPPPIFADEFQRLGLLGSGNGSLGHQQEQRGGNGRLGQQPLVQEQSRMMFGTMASGFTNHESGFRGNVSDRLSQKGDRMNVEAQFGVPKGREVVGASGSSKSQDIWLNSNLKSEFDREFELRSQQQWENSPIGGGRGMGRQPQQHQQQKQQHVPLRASPVLEPRSAPPGFLGKPKGFNQSGSMSARREIEGNVDREKGSQGKFNNKPSYNSSNHHGSQNNAPSRRLSGQLDHPGLPGGSKLWSVPASDIEESLATLHGQMPEEDGGWNSARHENRKRDEASGPTPQMSGRRSQDDLSQQLMNSVRLSNGLEKNIRMHSGPSQEKDHRPDMSRELQPPVQRVRNHRRVVECRIDIDRMNEPLLVIYESLVPAEEEKAKQRQLLTSLEKLVIAEWPKAQLYLYGSCANSFGVSKSDIDVCLAIEDEDINKSELLLKLADILQENNLENVQALTRARVPIVKLLDPVTGISCDICVNNVLAVVNTKLLRDYAQIDCRLRQLAFIVKHWAKLRGVNVTYHGTLSSYAYVLMCIHFLQQRRPAILPCLQGMAATHVVNVDDIECSFYDQVENLRDFGARNKETIAQLVWAFFDYWAFRHDYANAVISVRTGSIISKRAKDWTRRVGNDRHLICIEDPFEVSHDLGRVVDKYSIKILREEFERAANIMQYDPDPCVTLFERYIPPPPPATPTDTSK